MEESPVTYYDSCHTGWSTDQRGQMGMPPIGSSKETAKTQQTLRP
jgi:hypothetical protein